MIRPTIWPCRGTDPSILTMELEPSRVEFTPVPDSRPTLPEPLPVRLVAIDNVRSVAIAGLEREMDQLYRSILQFERRANLTLPDGRQVLVYAADNAELHFHVHEPVVERTDLRPLQIEVNSLAEAEQKLLEAGMEYTRQWGLTPGQESLLLQDPSGNWVEITERHWLG
ncbi:MAG: VOC family protein [Phycisphaerae bacterium]|nr:VOC family protein [Phycisphaerae bacterium]MDW8262906.1 VOC family protein [Phycisphaerales bacterium]